jgi:hypothetical protein
MQPTIHWNKKPDIEAVNVRVFLLMNCGLHFLFHRAHYSSYMLFVKKALQNRAHKIFLLGRSMSEWRKTINMTLLFNTCGFNDCNINVYRKCIGIHFCSLFCLLFFKGTFNFLLFTHYCKLLRHRNNSTISKLS